MKKLKQIIIMQKIFIEKISWKRNIFENVKWRTKIDENLKIEKKFQRWFNEKKSN